jgi:asparagine synthase (glutamine-hydrolysing)
MCGLFASNDPIISKSSHDVINSRLAFRGPDGQSELVIHHDWKLYHSRLSIIAPIAKYFQPFFSKDNDVIVFNGEILNFKELQFKYNLIKSDSDTETLNELLKLKNFNLNELEGFFAFVRIDNKGRITHCARDRFGVKPLYIYKRENYISISSEASVLSDLFQLDYSETSMEEYKVFRAPVFNGSFFNGVNPIEPGSCFITGKFFDCLSYFNKEYLEEKYIKDELKSAIADSIKSRLVSDVPVGLLYSGGIDSNLLNEICNKNLQKFTGGFQGDFDLEHSRKINNDTSKNIVLVEVSNEEFKKRFYEMVKLRKEPLSVPNEVILSFLAENWARTGGKVLISGEAADEFFAGYDRIFYWASNTKEFNVHEFLKHYCYVPIDEIPERIYEKTHEFFEVIKFLGPFEMVRYFFIKKHLPVLFRRLDFSLMFAGVEGREPLASFKMFKLALKCGPQSLFYDTLGKLPLRNLAQELVDKDFAFATKVGFPVDLGFIFRNSPSKSKYENYSIWCDENIGAVK